MKATFILSLVMAILIAIFALLNGTAVPVSFGFAKFESSLALIILGSVAIGAILIYLIDVVGKIKNAKRIRDLEKKVTQLEKELEEKAAIITKLSKVDEKPKTQSAPSLEKAQVTDTEEDKK